MKPAGWAVLSGLLGCASPDHEVIAWTSAVWSPGSPAAVRIVVLDAHGAPVSEVPVAIHSSTGRLYQGQTDALGTVPAMLTAPESGEAISLVIGGWWGQQVELPVVVRAREDTWVVPLEGGTGEVQAAIVHQDPVTGASDAPLSIDTVRIGAEGLSTERQLYDDPARGDWSTDGHAWVLRQPGALYVEGWAAGQLVSLASGTDEVALPMLPPQAVARAWTRVGEEWTLVGEAALRASVSGYAEGALSGWGSRPQTALDVFGELDAGAPVDLVVGGEGVLALALTRGSRSPIDASLRLQLVRPLLALDEVAIGREPRPSGRRPARIEAAPPTGELVFSTLSAPGERLRTPPLAAGRWTAFGLWLDAGGLAVTERALDVAAPLEIDVPWGADLLVGDVIDWPVRVRTRDGGSATLALTSSGGRGTLSTTPRGRRVMRWEATEAGRASATLEARWEDQHAAESASWTQRTAQGPWPSPSGGAIYDHLADCQVTDFQQGDAWGVLPGEAADVLSTSLVLEAGCGGQAAAPALDWLARQRLTDGSFAPPAGHWVPLGRRDGEARTLVTAWALQALVGGEVDNATTIDWLTRHGPQHRDGAVARRVVAALEAAGAEVPAPVTAYAALEEGQPDPGRPPEGPWKQGSGALEVHWPAEMLPGAQALVEVRAEADATWPMVVLRAPAGLRWETEGLGTNEDVRWWTVQEEELHLLMARRTLLARLSVRATLAGSLGAPPAHLLDPYQRLWLAEQEGSRVEISAPEVPLDAGDYEPPAGWR